MRPAFKGVPDYGVTKRLGTRDSAVAANAEEVNTEPTPFPMQVSSRREFLKTATVAGAAVTLSELTFRSMLTAAPLKAPTQALDLATAPSWIDKPMRWAQLL